MGKLNIAHHKSYHPYRRDNIERVRRDEEEAAAKEAREDGRVALADSEARIELLRERSGLSNGGQGKWKGKEKGKGKEKADVEELTGGVMLTSGGHINFFEDLEHSVIAKSIKAKKDDPTETEKGVPLAPSAKDLKPWYVSGVHDALDTEQEGEKAFEERRKRDRDLAFKTLNDPLTSITHQLASRSHSSPSAAPASKPQSRLLPRPSKSRPFTRSPGKSKSSSHPAPEPTPSLSTVESRLNRESTERERALALIARKKREMQGSETPSTVHGDYGGYTDVFNRKEVEDAHRGWGGVKGRERGRDGRGRRW